LRVSTELSYGLEMTNPDRIDLLWQLLDDAHPRYCINSRERHSASSLLTEPKNEQEIGDQDFYIAKDFYGKLLALNDEELSNEFQKLSGRKQALHEAKHPFNQPQALANEDVFQFWSRAELWSLSECAALINGRNPEAVTERRIEADQSQSKISISLKQTLDLLERARTSGTLHFSNNPKKLIDWLELKHIEMPPGLKKLVLQRSTTPFTLRDENKRLKEELSAIEANHMTAVRESSVSKGEKPVGPRERDSLLKLILGMAIEGYSYDPKATKSAHISEIASDLQIVGLALDEDTVRKYLNEAKALFSDVLNRTE
jgi:hypothetical protein